MAYKWKFEIGQWVRYAPSADFVVSVRITDRRTLWLDEEYRIHPYDVWVFEHELTALNNTATCPVCKELVKVENGLLVAHNYKGILCYGSYTPHYKRKQQ